MVTILSPNERLIIISLYDNPKCSCELADDLHKRDTVITHNLSKMNESNLVKYERTGIRKKYQLTNYGKSVYELLKTHDASFRDLITDYTNQVRDEKCTDY